MACTVLFKNSWNTCLQRNSNQFKIFLNSSCKFFPQKGSIFSIKNFYISNQLYNRTMWSYIRPKRNMPIVNLPNYLLDREIRRGHGRDGRNKFGKRLIRHRGGGCKQNYRKVDFLRCPYDPTNSDLVVKDKILDFCYDPCRTTRVALVAGSYGNNFKLILAAKGMQKGDIVTASRKPPASNINMLPGDTYPIRYLPIGTEVHNVEVKPGSGGRFGRAGGTSLKVIGKDDNGNVVLSTNLVKSKKKLPHLRRRQVYIAPDCLASIGATQSVDDGPQIIGKAGRNRRYGVKMRGRTGIDRWQHKRYRGKRAR